MSNVALSLTAISKREPLDQLKLTEKEMPTSIYIINYTLPQTACENIYINTKFCAFVTQANYRLVWL